MLLTDSRLRLAGIDLRSFAPAMTNHCLHGEGGIGIDDVIAAEAPARATCTQMKGYERAYAAFMANKESSQ